MSVIGIIAEYNPFHNGHLYHLNESLRLTGADSSVCVMSGDFLQRGIPAVADKYSRAYAASAMGIDAVFELPVLFATGNAGDFAMGAVSMLDSFGCVDFLCFGTETENLISLLSVSEILANEPSVYKSALKDALKAGFSFPAAREIALSEILGPKIKTILSTPNNILAIEYLTALIRLDSAIKPVIVPRKEAMYHDKTLNLHISSATAIREAIMKCQDISKDIPEKVYSLLAPFFDSGIPDTSDYSSVLSYLLTGMKEDTSGKQEDILDMNRDMMNRFLKYTPPVSYSELAEHMKKKNITMTRVNRAFLHFILDIKKSKRDQIVKEGFAHYANLLSFRKNNQVLKQIKSNANIPVIAKKADYVPQTDAAQILFSYDKNAASFYNQILFQKNGIRLPEELSSSVRVFPE